MGKFLSKAYNICFKKIIILVGLTILVLCLFGCSSGEDDDERDSSRRNDKKKSTIWDNWGSGDSKKESNEETKQEPKEKVYSITDSSGKYTLEAKPGFASVLYKEDRYGNSAKAARVQLPDLEAWSDGMFTRINLSISEKEHYYVYEAVGVTNDEALECVGKYHELLANYSVVVTVDESYNNLNDYTEWLGGDYIGTQSITSDSMEAYDDYFDMSFTYMDSFSETSYLIYCPPEISFVDYGDRYNGTKVQNPEGVKVYTNMTMPIYTKTSTGLDKFKITGWSEDNGDYIEIALHPEMYKKGDVFDLDYFANQANAGSGKLCSLLIDSESITCEKIVSVWTPNKEDRDRFKNVSVEILEKSDTVTAISYSIELKGAQGYDYTLEGVFAIQTGEETAGNMEQQVSNSGGSGISIGKNRCNSCSGTGKSFIYCTRCSSKGKIDCRTCYKGKVDCTKCGGDGKVWDGLNAREVYCNNCNMGKVNCSKCFGSGEVNCDNCGGDGKVEQDCHLCGGDGMW